MPEFSASPPFPAVETNAPRLRGLRASLRADAMNALHARLAPYLGAVVTVRADAWISACDTGAASVAIYSRMKGVVAANPNSDATPQDVGEFARCVRLYAFMPEWHARRREMAQSGGAWEPLCDVWDDLEATFLSEAGLFFEKSFNNPATASKLTAFYASLWSNQPGATPSI